VPAAGTTISDNLVSLLPNMPQQLADIKKQERWRQALAAVVLGGSATLAVLTDPTVAIVFAVLAIGAVSLVPPLRHQVFGDKLALRDAAGRVRFFAGFSESRPIFVMLDEAEKPRVLLGLGADESPQLSLHDDSATARVVLSAHPSISGVAVNGSDGHSLLEFVAPDDRGQIQVKDREGGQATLVVDMLGLQRDDERLAALSVTDQSTSLLCQAGERTVNCIAGEDQANVIARAGTNSSALSATDELGVIAAGSDNRLLRALASPGGVSLQSREGDGEWQPLIPLE